MFETLPVVIPTLRDVARGTLRPPAPTGDHSDHGDTLQAPTAAILLDAAAPDVAALATLYDELEMYLQATSIATLRLHRRGSSALAQMLDILAAVTLLRSQGYQRVILIVAAEGAIPRWERSRAETLAGMLEIVRRHHSGSAAELIGAIEDLVRTIRTVADSVIGVATILIRTTAPDRRTAPAARIEALSRPNGPGHRSRMSARAISPSSTSPASPADSPKALAISLGPGESAVSAVSQLYLWCRALAAQTPAVTPAPEAASDDASGLEMLERERAVTQLREAGAGFRATLRWLDEQWSALVGDLARLAPQSAARILSAMSLPAQATGETHLAGAESAHEGVNNRVAWRYLDGSTRLRWLELCQQAFENLREGALVTERVD